MLVDQNAAFRQLSVKLAEMVYFPRKVVNLSTVIISSSEHFRVRSFISNFLPFLCYCFFQRSGLGKFVRMVRTRTGNYSLKRVFRNSNGKK